ncbi:MAG TPA: choice-of-anchor Q domain-containing protein [Sedimentisphaerales bacterium]|nr:choice-of-anchor Q domain-containing protein [Sedimentisphaerales bacterium]
MQIREKKWNAMMAVLLALATSTFAYSATIPVDTNGDIAAANEIAQAGDTIEISAGTYILTSPIEIKDGVTYRGAGSEQTVIDCGGITRAFVGWGDRSQNDQLLDSETGYPANTSGPKGWVIQGLSIINGVADDVDKVVQRVGDPTIIPPLTANIVLDPFKSTNGGGILLENYAEGSLVDVAFDNCNALAIGVDAVDPTIATYLGSGGAVYMGSATANILNCSFANNNASSDGGAISASNSDLENLDLSIESSTFINNRARDDGSAIYVVRRNLSVINSVGDGNKSGLDPAVMADNVSGDPDGGFLYITGADKVAGTSYTEDTPPLEMTNYGGVVTLSGCTITNGEARRGGGICSNSAAQLNVADTSFANCNAIYDGDGGTIFANSPSPFNPAAFDPNDPNSSPVGDPGVYLDGVTIDGSSSADDGGGINIDNWGVTSDNNYIEAPKVVIRNSIIRNCRAGSPAPDDGNRDGGGIRLNNRLDVAITNTLVENCTAGRNAAGIYFAGIVSAALIDGCRISNCHNDDISGEGGDGVALNMEEDDNVSVVVSNCIFDNNTNRQDDAVVRIDADTLVVANCTFVGNRTADHGILYFNTGRADPLAVTNKAVNNLFVNNDSSPGSDNILDWNKDQNNNITLNNGFFGSILDNDSQIEDTADADLGFTGNFIAAADPLVDMAGGDYHLAPSSEAVDKGIAEDAPDHDFDGNVRPQGAAHDVGAYESPGH